MLTASERGLLFAGHTFDVAVYPVGTLRTAQLDLNAPVSITIHFSALDVADIPDTTQLMLYDWDGTHWHPITERCTPAPVAEIDVEQRVFTIDTCYLGRLGLFAPDPYHRVYLPIMIRQ